MSFALADIERRLANLLKVGTVEEVDHDNALARVRIGDNLTKPLPWLTARAGGDGTWWPVEVGEQVLILSPCGDLTQGVILPSLYRTASPAPSSKGGVERTEYKDGAVIQYDRNTHTLTASIPGDVKVTATGNITADAGENITLTAPNILLSAGQIQLAGPLVAVGVNGEAHSATFHGDITHVEGDYDNPDGDVVAGTISLKEHTHTEQGDGNETSKPN